MKLSKIYNQEKVEKKIYNLWIREGFFNPDKLPDKRKKSFTIVLPPPNVTGELHMGHALNAVIQDILIRWKRLQGYKTLWIPGTDHAGIATQNKVEKELKKEGLNKADLGRKEFIKRVWEWKKKYGNIILEQLKSLGASCDWSRTRFTLDKEYIKAVETAFLNYYKKGWIYQGKRVVNWCPRCQTSLSDLELEYKEEKGKLYYLKYPIAKKFIDDTCNNFIIVATTRPETMFGDTAVAVNPKDKRYKNLKGKKVILPIVKREIPIIEDRLIDPKFGTGAVKVTPAHSLTDYEIALKHNLPLIQVISEKVKLTKEVPFAYQEMGILEARKKIIEDLEKQGLVEKIEDYTHQLPICYRCKAIIESIPSEQWFLKMKELAKIAEAPVRNGKIKFHPKSFEKVYFNWLKNVRDWCISRQLWWGHTIPLKGVDDVLDTWFSSALWPFATLGWPKKTKDLKTFYPTDVLSTGRDIINIWVTRMIFSGMEFMKKEPFRNVYIHATVLTKEGKRMSKSLGIGINPMDIIKKYGADATRFGIAWNIMGGQDIKFTEDNIIMGRKFCNKLWNATRFVLQQNTQLNYEFKILKNKNLTMADKKILKALDKTTKSVNKDLESFRFGQAAHTLYNFFWHDFCDKYIEETKKQDNQKILLYVLSTSLKLLHPFIPFITEEIYQKLPIKNKKRCLIVEKWPKL